jgi:uncharacterized protein (TIGR00251 family)
MNSSQAMLTPALRWMAGNGPTGTARVLLSCRVKPRVSAAREGIAALTDEYVEICVQNPARDGAANKGVLRIVAEALQVPKSDITLAKGLKSREKVVAVNVRAKASPEENLNFVRSLLLEKLKR